jgi:hypothetical protein
MHAEQAPRTGRGQLQPDASNDRGQVRGWVNALLDATIGIIALDVDTYKGSERESGLLDAVGAKRGPILATTVKAGRGNLLPLYQYPVEDKFTTKIRKDRDHD